MIAISALFSTRYASDEMQYIFSDDNKFRTWRRLWVALARAEMDQGLTNITPDMVAELEAHVDDINYEVAIEREKLGAPRRHEPCLRLRPAVPQGSRHHPSGCHQLLCGRQHRHHRDAAGSGAGAQKAGGCAGKAGTLCQGVQGYALHGLHPLPARTAHHRGQACYPVGQRTGDGSGRDRPSSGYPAAARCQGHHRYAGFLYGAVQGRCRQDPRCGCFHCKGDGL